MNAIDEPLGLKIRFLSRDLVLSDRVTCTIASRMNFFDTKKPPPLANFHFHFCSRILVLGNEDGVGAGKAESANGKWQLQRY